jgi:hypothetical protein
MIRLLTVILAIALWSAPAHSGDAINFSANAFVDACRGSSGPFRSREAATDAAFNTGECMGFIKGVLATTDGHCIPAEVIMGQIIRVVVQYVDARPARAHEPFATLVKEAVRTAWPCKP